MQKMRQTAYRLLGTVAAFVIAASLGNGAPTLSAATASTWRNATVGHTQEAYLADQVRAIETQRCGSARSHDSQLHFLAEFKTADMAYRAYKAHTAPDGWGTDDGLRNAGVHVTGIGEVLGWNTYADDVSAQHIWQAWQASPGHWSIITDCRWTKFGVAAFKAVEIDNGTPTIVRHYAIEFAF